MKIGSWSYRRNSDSRTASEISNKTRKERSKRYTTLENAKKKHRKAPLGSIAGHFSLYSSDHVEYCYNSYMYRSKYVEFYHPDEDDPSDQPLPDSETYGHLYLDSDTVCQFGPFPVPKYAGLKEFRLASNGGKHELVFQILSKNHLKLKISWGRGKGRQKGKGKGRERGRGRERTWTKGKCRT